MNNLGLKLVSLLLACILWWYVSLPRREQVNERIVTASLSLVGVKQVLGDTEALRYLGHGTVTARLDEADRFRFELIRVPLSFDAFLGHSGTLYRRDDLPAGCPLNRCRSSRPSRPWST